jgi:hypothetical protein
LTEPDVMIIVSQRIREPAALGEMVMKIRPIVIAMVAGLVLPLAGANARAIFDPGLNQAGAGADLQRGAAHSAENFGRTEDEGKGDKDGKCDDGDHSDKGDHGDDDCDKSPSKPH